MTLGEYLLAATSRRRRPGLWDCGTFTCGWAIAHGWPDPLARWRGTYASDDEVHALADSFGGLTALFAAGFGSAGVPPVSAPFVDGDVGVVVLPTTAGSELAGGICVGGRWAFAGERGLVVLSVNPDRVLAAWRVGHG
jgi:hypothetical protein